MKRIILQKNQTLKFKRNPYYFNRIQEQMRYSLINTVNESGRNWQSWLKNFPVEWICFVAIFICGRNL